jgi:choline dehydrogenase-like flavoprotein
MTVKINADTSDGLKFVSDTSGAIDLQSNGTTKVSLDSSGNLEVNNGNLTIDKSASPNLLFNIGGTEKGYIRQNANDLESNSGSGNVLFRTGGTERMRVDSAGRLRFNTSNAKAKATFGHAGATDFGIALENSDSGSASQISIRFQRNTNTDVGSITTTNTATAFNVSSDYRLKENIDYSWDATTRLKELKPCRFNFKIDTDNTVDGFLAHEVSSIVPEAVTGTKDATKVQDVFDSDGVKTGTETVPDYQGIDQSKLVPLLVKTIQELEARITALES